MALCIVCLLAESYETINQSINPKQCLPHEAKKTIPKIHWKLKLTRSMFVS